MTYCVAMKLDHGLVYLSDTRTNAGVDNISTVTKMRSWDVPGERTITLLSAGNLATTQAVVSWLDERNKTPGERAPSILAAPTMFEVARIVGDTLATEVAARSQTPGQTMDAAFAGTLILGGQIKGADPRLYLIYPEGNFIEATEDNPFFQIGEAKYGKPILIRAFEAAMDFRDAVRLMLVSMDSTVRANLSVAPPFNLRYVKDGEFTATHERRIEGDDPYFRTLSEGWGEALRKAIPTLPSYEG
jgi:putative proteasome-type protease